MHGHFCRWRAPLQRELVMNAWMKDILAAHFKLPAPSLELSRISGSGDQGVYSFAANGRALIVKSFAGESALLQMKAECEGLKTLSKSCTIFRIPEIHQEVLCGEQRAFYVMDRIEQVRSQGSWEQIGIGLAELHSTQGFSHGLEYSNFIVSIPQLNAPKKSWPEFFRENRVLPMVSLAADQLKNETVRGIEQLCSRFEELFPDEKPSLLHGDLWAGNCLVSEEGVWLIDPAIYYGSREMDIAMTQLFGGFDRRMIEVYQHHFPMQSGWEERLDLCNLYPLLVHVNLFGSSYVNQLEQVVSKFTS